MPTVRRPLDEELTVLNDLLVRMSDLVEEQFTSAVEALERCDSAAAKVVRRRDDEVDALELEIDRQCERMLALYQPVATDLRALIVAVKVNTDLERMGDHAKNVAKDVPHVACAPEAIAAGQLLELADAVRAMLREAHDAFVGRDRTLAEHARARDAEVDKLYRASFDRLVAYGRSNGDHFEAAAHLLAAAKSMERIGDHAKNIAESVIFLVGGEDLRHRKLRRRLRRATQPSEGEAAGLTE